MKRLITMCFLAFALIATACSGNNSNDSNDVTGDATVCCTIPANGDTDVFINRSVAATFSKEMDPATITAKTFTLKQGTTPVAGNVTYAGTAAVFNPTNNLAANTIYTAEITTGARSLAGNALAVGRKWSFETGTLTDTTAPTVSSTIPATAAIDVANNSNIAVTFSEGMDPTTITTSTIILTQGATTVPGSVTYACSTATFNPSADLAYSTTYTVTITTGVKDLAGNPLAVTRTWNFTTGVAPDTTAPTVSSTLPVNLSNNVAINSNITATFSEGMNPLTITDVTFTLKQGSTPVLGDVTYVGTVATFNPTVDLAFSTTYTATITTGVKDLAGNALAVKRTWTFTTGAAPDIIPPTVSSTIPANGATSVAINSNITATFSEGMDPLTITNVTFTLKQGATPVSGDVTYVGVVATFNPTVDLAFSTTYTATITTGVKDLAGNALVTVKTWTFTTGAAPDITPPTVSTTIPADLSANVGVNGNITANFSEGMDPLTITNVTFTLKQGATPVSGDVTYAGLIATFNPTVDLAFSTTYTATITTGVKDLAGNALVTVKTWTFTTGAAPDITPPTVSLTTPVNGATGVVINSNVTATFSEGMDPLTITNVTFTLKQGATPVSGDVTYVGTVATFNPTSDLLSNTTYTATITTGAKDLAGNALAGSFIWTFTTGAAVAAGPAPVNLGTAINFVILSKAGITNVPTSAITGDIGVSPIAATAITGFALVLDALGTFSTAGQVTGHVYAADYASPTPSNLTTAVSNMETAYTDAAGRTTPDFINLGAAGDIGGLTLAPGLYKWNSGVSMSSDITLNGGANDVWIFQIPGVLSMANATTVHLTGGAQAKNIYWQTISCTLGTTSHLEGNVLSQSAITLATGATVTGRLFAQTAVTLQQNTVHP